jgi:hypothetical protein
MNYLQEYKDKSHELYERVHPAQFLYLKLSKNLKIANIVFELTQVKRSLYLNLNEKIGDNLGVL